MSGKWEKRNGKEDPSEDGGLSSSYLFERLCMA